MNLAFLFGCLWKSSAQSFKCDPCIEREQVRIEAICHGTRDDPFWQQIEAAAIQTGKELGIQFKMTLYDHFDPSKMAADIRAAATNSTPPDALIVTIPSQSVASAASAVADAVSVVLAEARVPIFGFNSGYKVAISNGAYAWVAQDEYLAGVAAADEFLRKNSNITADSALYINHESGNTALEDRYQGFKDRLCNETYSNETFSNTSSCQVGYLILDTSLSADGRKQVLATAFHKCLHDAVLLAGATYLGEVLTLNDCPNTVLGTFDENADAFAAIEADNLAFCVSQQPFIQASLPVLLATLFATTGRIPVTPGGEFGIYLSGPKVIDSKNVPSSTQQYCIDDAFPVCSNQNFDSKTSQCPCTNRTNMKFGAVVHGSKTDIFWNTVFAGAEQAARDMNGVEIDLVRFDQQPSDEVLHLLMASQISEFCSEGVDGLIVTIPSNILHGAVLRCLELGIPLIVINTGAKDAAELGTMLYIGELEFNAGFAAAKQLIAGGMKRGWCLNYEAGNQATVQRCQGMEAAISGVTEARKGIVGRITLAGR